MGHTMTLESQALAEELHKLIQLLDPANWRSELEAGVRERITRLKTRLATLLDQRVDSEFQPLQDALRGLAIVVEEGTRQRDWSTLFSRLQPAYESVAVRLRGLQVEVPELRTTNYKRSLVHASSGIVSFVCLEWFMSRPAIMILTSTLLFFVVLAETTRRFSPAINTALMKVFSPIAHPHEFHRMNSASWYAIALFILAFTASTMACSLAVLVLGFADPAAAMVGRRFGRIKLRGGRTLEGSLAFVAVAMVVSMVVITTLYSQIGIGAALGIALVAGVFGAVAEIFSSRWLDDNLTIPVAVGLGVTLISFVLL